MTDAFTGQTQLSLMLGVPEVWLDSDVVSKRKFRSTRVRIKLERRIQHLEQVQGPGSCTPTVDQAKSPHLQHSVPDLKASSLELSIMIDNKGSDHVEFSEEQSEDRES
eukprot:73070-Rhodomonas_salina.2